MDFFEAIFEAFLIIFEIPLTRQIMIGAIIIAIVGTFSIEPKWMCFAVLGFLTLLTSITFAIIIED